MDVNNLRLDWAKVGEDFSGWRSRFEEDEKRETEEPKKPSRKIEQDVNRMLSRGALSQLRRAFGIMGLPFFEFYLDLRRLRLGKQSESEDDLWTDLRHRVRQLSRAKLSPPIQNLLTETLNEVKPWLRQIERDPHQISAWRKIVEALGSIIPLVAKDKGVFLKPRFFGAERWSAFRIMRKSEAELEKFKDTDPALYEAIVEYKGQLSEIDNEIKEHIAAEGLEYERKFMLGRAVHIGRDPFSGERLVFDRATRRPVPVADYIEKRKKELHQTRSRTFPGTRFINALRRVSDESIDELTSRVEYVSLTDDKGKSSGLTRIYPVKAMWDGRRVISGGRYKGIILDDIVNAAGRMIEGTAYNYDPQSGRTQKIEIKGRGGKPTIRAEREPYVTVATFQAKPLLFLKIPAGSAFTEMRQAVARLAKAVPTIHYVERSRKSEFYFEPKDFEAVRDALQGMAMSEAASRLLREYFEMLAHAEIATAKENLGHYTTEAIGGFKRGRELLTKQKQALAWMEARGNNGVCALDTGVGKTVVAIAMMQKLKRDQAMEDTAAENNGRYLYVCPKALKGNIIAQIRHFLSEEFARELINQVDIRTYRQFGNERRKDTHFGEDYIAVFFDEAQELKNLSSKTTKAALSLNHPRKILLTASPLERQPTESYVLAAIANNEDLGDKDTGRAKRRDMRRFQARFAETIGGRVVGVKQDPLVKREMQTWVKQNIFYADKQDVEEFELPKLTRRTVALVMDPEIEEAYRETIGKLHLVFRGMVSRFRDKGRDPETGLAAPESRDKRIESMFSLRMAPILKRLNDLANRPERVIPAVPMRDDDGNPVIDAITGQPRMVPTRNPKIDESLRIVTQARENKGGRTLLFTDDPSLVDDVARQLSERMPGLMHVAGGAKHIQIYQNGRALASYDEIHKLPFREKNYRLFPDEPVGPGNLHYKKAEWQTFAFREIINPEHRVATATLQGQIYQVGQNLQVFSTVIHLDRDTWNSEDMKQRTARAWRQGQEAPVTEITLDATYDAPTDELDRTLDEIRRYLQSMDETMFDAIIKESQVLALGQEYFDMRRTQAKFYDVDRKSMELMLSPYLDRSDVPART